MTSLEWTKLKPALTEFYLPRSRSGHSASLYEENILVIFGGILGVTKELDDVVGLDLLTWEWFQITEPKQTRGPLVTNPLLAKLGK